MNKGSCIIVGRCADYLLKDRKDVLKIFIYGDMDTRKKRIVGVYKEASEEAADLIKKQIRGVQHIIIIIQEKFLEMRKIMIFVLTAAF